MKNTTWQENRNLQNIDKIYKKTRQKFFYMRLSINNKK